MIPFNKPYYPTLTQKNILDSLGTRHISGDGKYNSLVSNFFSKEYGFKYNLTTTSCTDALELIALTIGIEEGDEVIIPDYTFVSTANAFLLRGAKIIFADSKQNSPNINLKEVYNLINLKTKALVIVHYAGIANDLHLLERIREKFPDLKIIEDAAQSINTFYSNLPVGLFGDFAAFSFHETKNITCGEGGLFVCKNEQDFIKAEIIREKGTNRKNFIRGEVDKYGWKRIGSSFLPSDILMSILYSQLLNIEEITLKRLEQWNLYYSLLIDLKEVKLPYLDPLCSHNGHIFYILLPSAKLRNDLMKFLRKKNIQSTFHYTSLSNSNHISIKNFSCNNSKMFSDCLLRLPLFYELKEESILKIIQSIKIFFKSNI